MFSKAQVKSLRTFVDTLRALHFPLVLPEIVVCGDTSSGKSSLLSALTLIELPSDKDICTKCPTRIALEQSDVGTETSCSTRVQWHKDSLALKNSPDEVKELERPTICRLDDVTKRISELQTKVLDLDRGEGDVPGRCNVSKSVVEVTIRGPDRVNLTVIDLPGMVATLGADDAKDIVERIDEIISEYTANERAIIIPVHPANVDFHNSRMLARAIKCDPNTTRTLPVITKVDLVDKGAEQSVIKLAKGQSTRETFHLGFHVVKLRGQKDLSDKKSFESSIADETRFFESGPYTKEIEPCSRGIPALRKRLAALYFEMLSTTVPKIIAEVEGVEKQTLDELKSLGADLSTPELRLSEWSKIRQALVDDVCRLPQLPSGKADMLTVRTELEAAKATFQQTLRKRSRENEVHVGAAVSCLRDKAIEKFTVFFVQEDGDNSDKCALIPQTTEEALDSTVIDFLAAPNSGHDLRFFCREELFLVQDLKPYIRVGKNQYRQARLFDESEFHLCSGSIEDEIKSQREKVLEIFEAEAVFNRRVHRWIDGPVTTAVEALVAELSALLKRVFVNSINRAVCHVGHESLKNVLTEVYNTVHRRVMDQLTNSLHGVLLDEYLPQTKNNYFGANLEQLRNNRLSAELLSGQVNLNLPKNNQPYIPVSHVLAVLKQRNHRPLSEFAAEEASLYLQAYFKVARKTIVDNVAKTVDTVIALTNVPTHLPHVLTRLSADQQPWTIENTLRAALDEVEDPSALLVSERTVERRRQVAKLVDDLRAVKKLLPALRRELVSAEEHRKAAQKL